MLLSTWIDKNGGTMKTGNLLGLKRNVVYAWRKGVALPRPAAMKAIVTKSGGRVSYGEMIDEYLAKKKNGKATKKVIKTASKKKSTGKTTKPSKATPKKAKGKKVDPGF